MKIAMAKNSAAGFIALGIASAALALGAGTANSDPCYVEGSKVPCPPSLVSTGPGTDKPDTAVAPGEWKLENLDGDERWFNGTRDEAQAKADAGYAGRETYTSRGDVPDSDGSAGDVG